MTPGQAAGRTGIQGGVVGLILQGLQVFHLYEATAEQTIWLGIAGTALVSFMQNEGEKRGWWPTLLKPAAQRTRRRPRQPRQPRPPIEPARRR